MNKVKKGIFREYAPIFREAGLWPRPLTGKACKISGWQKPDPEWPPETIDNWVENHPDHNIGLLMGSPLPDGSFLGAIDVDHDDYVDLSHALLGDNLVGRVGKKGAAYFVRVKPGLKSQSFRVKESGKYGQIVDCLFEGKIVAIPPSVHPETNEPYRWTGDPLHEISFDQLPLIGE